MLATTSPQRDRSNRVRFPRIDSKPKSIPGDKNTGDVPDDITAKAWLYCSSNTQYGVKTGLKRQIASLTKIMTALCTLELCEKYKMNRMSTYFKVTEWAAGTNGTTANLVDHAWMSIEDLLYGLMLPSGNDAATVLAQNLGAVIYFDKAGNKSLIQGQKLEVSTQQKIKKVQSSICLSLFPT